MLFLMLAAALFALLIGALAFVTGPVGGAMAGAIALWLLLYAARSLHRRRPGRGDGPHGRRGSGGRSGHGGRSGDGSRSGDGDGYGSRSGDGGRSSQSDSQSHYRPAPDAAPSDSSPAARPSAGPNSKAVHHA